MRLVLVVAAAVARGDATCKWALGTTGLCGWMEHVDVETDCTFALQPGMWVREDGVQPHTGPALELRLARRSVVVRPHTVNSTEVPQRVLCLSGRQPLVLLKVANSYTYLFRFWPYFVAIVEWARKSDFAVGLWVGELPKELATKVSAECAASPEFGVLHQPKTIMTKKSWYAAPQSKGVVSNHHAKILASYALLNDPIVQGVFYTDLDAYVEPRVASMAAKAYHRVHSEGYIDIVFNKEAHDAFWRVKSSTFYVRDVQVSRLLLASWITYRCGFKDQYSLWHAVLTLASTFGCLPYNGEIFSNSYRNGSTLAEFFPHLHVNCDTRRSLCPSFRFCAPKEVYENYAKAFSHKSIPSFAVRTIKYLRHDNGYYAYETTVFQDMLRGATNSEFLAHLGLSFNSSSSSASWM